MPDMQQMVFLSGEVAKWDILGELRKRNQRNNYIRLAPTQVCVVCERFAGFP